MCLCVWCSHADALYQCILRSYQHCNTSRPGPHVGDCSIYGCKPLLFVKTPDCKLGAGIYTKEGSLDHKVAEVIQEYQITGAVDFKGKTSSALAKLFSPGGTIGTFSGSFSSDNFSVSVGFWAEMSAETEEAVLEVSKSM